MHDWQGWGLHGFWWLFGFAIIAIAIWLAVDYMQREPSSPLDETALEILKKRFARGEISKAEFEEAKRSLNENE